MGVQLCLTWLTALLPRQPELFNFLAKERFLKLPEAFRGEAVQRMQETMDVIGVLAMLIMFAVQVLLWRSALGHTSKNALPLLMIATVAFIPVALVLTSRVNQATEAAERKWRAATAKSDP